LAGWLAGAAAAPVTASSPAVIATAAATAIALFRILDPLLHREVRTVFPFPSGYDMSAGGYTRRAADVMPFKAQRRVQSPWSNPAGDADDSWCALDCVSPDSVPLWNYYRLSGREKADPYRTPWSLFSWGEGTGVTVRIRWRVLFTLFGGLTDHLFEVRTYLHTPHLQRCRSTRRIPPDNSNRTRHLIRTEPAIRFDK